MSTQHIQLNVPLSFNQVVDIVRQLSPNEKIKLKEVLQESEDIDEYVIPEEQKYCKASGLLFSNYFLSK